ncbi:MAG: family 20 glycosylhydrolase [Chloroflexi bacterium]|nr:family 20 glycosylhydrolase [Chloroflexota bacterium]
MPEVPLLLPYPRKLTFTDGVFEGDTLDRTVAYRVDSEIVPQGYRLHIRPGGISIDHSDRIGADYARRTLTQLSMHYGKSIPAMDIEDAPDFARRGVMLDCSRDRVPQMKTLYTLVDKLASWKINELQLYMEHTFAYDGHRDVWEKASPFTPSDIQALDDYCRTRHIDLVPCQSTLGHMERWLKHARYHNLAETPEGFLPPWENLGRIRPPSTLAPLDPGSFQLVAGLFDQLIPAFSSQHVNICGDEPWELGMGKSRAAVEEQGGRVYFDYLMKVYQHLKAKGKRVQFWADIITKYADLVPELPLDIIPLVWGYEAWEPSEHQIQLVSESGLEFYVCPGTSSWNSLVGRTDNTLDNLRLAADLGQTYRAMGYLITDWGDNGHWQALPISYLGFAFGAGMGWYAAGNRDMNVPEVLNRFAFEDDAGVMGKIAYDLGNLYKLIPLPQHNSHWLFTALQYSDAELRKRYDLLIQENGAEPLPAGIVRAIMNEIRTLLDGIQDADLREEDALVKAEYRQACELLLHGAKRLLRLLGESNESDATLKEELKRLIARQKTLWLERSRPGGLDDSLERFTPALQSYS